MIAVTCPVWVHGLHGDMSNGELAPQSCVLVAHTPTLYSNSILVLLVPRSQGRRGQIRASPEDDGGLARARFLHPQVMIQLSTGE
jgi:hypothetical protein